ncbi:hypothetical protein L596_002754 [Steinernema carpocapsae]|uniref:Myosin motor domain-containing protein n=1 Tax=Steinernema carpocapsae TaxID=34508 RepID=A0A4U8UT27_STECR|nr:hypothetical protein L596_002754 [Steinernema carpocapsae]
MDAYEKDPGWQYLKRSREQILKDQSKPYDSKKNVWIPDAEEGYLAATVVSTNGDKVTVTVDGTGSEKTVKKDVLQEMNPPKFEKTDDMSNLTFLNDASVLYNLRARYASMLIYTYSGLFCIVVNPYKRLPIYTDSVARIFMGKRRTEMPPHLFAVSDEAYRSMLMHKENQSMLITGESGAGKTENTKKVISYFASVGASQQEGNANSDEKKVTLEDQIVQTNPVLEAFGNAKTVRNNNSSRFGKFIRIHFNRAGRLASCDIEHYRFAIMPNLQTGALPAGSFSRHLFVLFFQLLRLEIRLSSGEVPRDSHQIFSDHIPQLKKDLLLNSDLKEYWFVAQAELTIDGIDDVEEFKLTDEAFDILKFSKQEKMECYKLMAALMHMGNMKFKQRPREEQAEADGMEDAERAAAMYGIDPEKFVNALVKPRVKVGTEWVSKGQNMEQVNWAIGAMAKGLYARVFHWLVKKCNVTLDQKGFNRDYFIGVLDIAGFEIFDFNSFEQLWINFVNEKLQQFFNHHMFVLEQEEYAREGIQWTFIDFGLDLQACIELIEKPLGIISMLDEESIVPKGTDMSLAQKLSEQHLGKHPNFEKPKPPKGKQAEAHFAMRHYAGTVRYNVLNWLEKNKDPLNDTVVSVMKQGKENALLLEVWSDYTTQEEAVEKSKQGGGGGGKKKGKSGSFMTVSMLYRESLNKLMEMLHKTHPHFIRCIIPNEKKASGVIDAALVLNQLTCNGVLEGIRICRKGFPNRTVHPDFVERYTLLAAKEANGSEDPKQCAEAILIALVRKGDMTEEQFRVGLTKVFFKAGVVAHMEDLRDNRLAELISGFQAQIRWYNERIREKQLKEELGSLLTIQKNIRSWGLLRTWEWFKVFGMVKPHLKSGKQAEEMEKLGEEIKSMGESLTKIKAERAKVEKNYARLLDERNQMLEDLEMSKESGTVVADRIDRMAAGNTELSKTLAEASERLTELEARNSDVMRLQKTAERDQDNMKKNIQDISLTLEKSASENLGRENQIGSLRAELNKQDQMIAMFNKEKKQREEENRKIDEDLQAEQEKGSQAKKIRNKMERVLDQLDEEFEREKRLCADVEKSKRKTENELRLIQEKLSEITKQKQDTEAMVEKKTESIKALSEQVQDEQELTGKLQKQTKDIVHRLEEVEEEMEHERQARASCDRAKGKLQTELEDLSEQIDRKRGVTTAQMELNKKKDAEIAKLVQKLDEITMSQKDQSISIRKRTNDSAAELSHELDIIQMSKSKSEKEKENLKKQLEGASQDLDRECRAKVEQERQMKLNEVQVAELQAKCDEQHRQLQDFGKVKGFLQNEGSDLASKVEEMKAKVATTSRQKALCVSKLEEAKRNVDDESKERQSRTAHVKGLETELEQLRESINEEIENKFEIIRQVSKVNEEVQQWREKFECEGFVNQTELDEFRQKQQVKVLELRDQLDAANSRIIALDKQNSKLTSEIEGHKVETERCVTNVDQLNKKERLFDGIVGEWRGKLDSVLQELSAAHSESHLTNANIAMLKSTQTILIEEIESLRRENKSLSQELKDMNEQLGVGSRSAHEIQKMIRRVEIEKEELNRALDDATAALEDEENKVLRTQAEVCRIRGDIELRVRDKEEEFENTRKTHSRAIESMQASLDAELQVKEELQKTKKKLENEINKKEVALDHTSKINQDTQKAIKSHIEKIKELQAQYEEGLKQRDSFKQNLLAAEKRLALTEAEKEQFSEDLMQAEKSKKLMEVELAVLRNDHNEIHAHNLALTSTKKKFELEISQIKVDGTRRIFRKLERKTLVDTEKLSEDLKNEKDHNEHMKRVNAGLEKQISDMNVKLDDVKSAALKGGQKSIVAIEARIFAAEKNLQAERRKHQDAVKEFSRSDRKLREINFQLEEQKKSNQKVQETIESLHQKQKVQRKQLEAAEELANMNLQKYRKVQLALANAEERADHAEESMLKMKSKSRNEAIEVAES